MKHLKSQEFIEEVSSKEEIKNMGLYLISYFLTWIFSVIGAQFLAAEFFALYKRLGMLFGSYFVDFKLKNNMEEIPVKEIIIVLLILIISLHLFFRLYPFNSYGL